MEEKTFLTVDEVAEILTVSKSKAYEIVRQLNKELKEKGLITVAARVSKAYFYERMCYSKEQWKGVDYMSVYKDNATGKWRVIYRYTDITGKRKQTQKRGFETKREAVAWEHEMMLKARSATQSHL